VTASSVSDDLDWWRANRTAANVDPAALRGLLARLRAWKVEHDADRARQPPPFLQMAWDGVFGDEDSRVTEAIGELEQALADESA
jgi:hypothetical protein